MGEILTAAGIIVGVLVAVMRIQKGHTANIAAQEAHLRNQIKVELYQRASQVFEDTARALSTASIQPLLVVGGMRRVAFGVQPHVTDQMGPINEKHMAAVRGIGAVIRQLEQYEIVFHRFRSFRRQLARDHKVCAERFSALLSQIAPLLALETPTGETVRMAQPTIEDVERLEHLQREYSAVCDDLAGYMVDLQIEAQNELLGPLFDRQLPPRNPQDETVQVLGRDEGDFEERVAGHLA